MVDEKLIEKIMLQVDGLLRGNLAKVLEDFKELSGEVSEPKLTATLKIRLKKKKGIIYDSAVSWNKGLKRGDVSDAEVYDTDTPDMFDARRDGVGFQKLADDNKVEISMSVNGGKEIPLAKPRKMKV